MQLSVRRSGAMRRRAGRLSFAGLSILLATSGCSEQPVFTDGDPVAQIRSGASTAAPAIEVVSPSEGSWISGRQSFQAGTRGLPLESYRMAWQVDGDGSHPMYDDPTGQPLKAATVDVGGWTWRGSGPYRVTFVAYDRAGRVIATRSHTVHVGGEPPTRHPSEPAMPVAGNPFAGAVLWVDPHSDAHSQVAAWDRSRPADAETIARIAGRPQAIWLGEWLGDVRRAVDARTDVITAAGALPVFVAYNIPQRDCGQYSAGGSTRASDYRAWIRSIASGIGARDAVVILEPDALGLLTDCLSPAEQRIRLELLAEAVRTLKQTGRTAVYIDAGNPRWHSAEVMAARLMAAGIEHADGFSLNVSNFQTTAANIAYGERLSARVGGKRFVIDTSRNGLGPSDDPEWCNPSGRALGHPPTANTGHPLVDAFLWIKRPGESDGECNGGPSAGRWWAEHALGLARRMPESLAMLP